MRKKEQVNRLITSMIFSLVAISALSQSNNERPTLIVGITIDQLRNDYLELLQDKFGNDGFKRLMREGVYIENAVFNVSSLDKVSASAILYTGTTPNINGISGATLYKDGKIEETLHDPKYIGNTTDATYSPMALKVSTISDEVRMDNNGIGYVYSVAPDAQQAIIIAGHAANGAFWINDDNGKWASSTFYKEFPAAVQNRNFIRQLSSRIDTLKWTPLLKTEEYRDIALHRTFYPFKYTFDGENRYQKFKKSALVNEEVTSVAISCIEELRLGRRAAVDMINVAYTAEPYSYAIDSDNRIELQDKYLRLDRELAKLFASIDKAVGRNAFIFVSSTGYFDNTYATEPRFNIPTGEFSPKRAVSLLNMYLMAIYGNGNWVNGYYNEQFFLNDKLAKEKNIPIEELREKSGDFLRRMSGISKAYTFDEILNNPVNDALVKLNHTVYAQTAGDVYIEITPGWSVNDDVNETSENQTKYVRNNAFAAPMFIMAPNITAEKITIPVDATLLAPTVSRILRIRSPNAAERIPLSL